MPVINPQDISSSTISYSSWSSLVSINRVRYFEFPGASQYLAAFGKLGVVLITSIIDSADISHFDINYKPSGLLATSEFEMVELCSLDAAIGKLDGRQQKAYEFGTTVIYTGYAEFGISQASSGWTIKKLDLDGSGNPTAERWTAVGVAIWNNRASETYI